MHHIGLLHPSTHDHPLGLFFISRVPKPILSIMVSKNMQRALSSQLHWRYVILDEGHKVGWSVS